MGDISGHGFVQLSNSQSKQTPSKTGLLYSSKSSFESKSSSYQKEGCKFEPLREQPFTVSASEEFHHGGKLRNNTNVDGKKGPQSSA